MLKSTPYATNVFESMRGCWYRYWLALNYLFLPRQWPGFIAYGRRLVLTLPLLIVTALMGLVHSLGGLLDELLFRRYRAVVIRQPVFILGAPRSGTTSLLNALSDHPKLTSLTLRESLLAPTITERYVWSGIAAVDRRLGAPLGRAFKWAFDRLFNNGNSRYPMSLDQATEDHLVLLPGLDCYLWAIVFPEAPWLWELNSLDALPGTSTRQDVLQKHRRYLQKHLYFHGEEKTLLSKNPTFSGCAHTLLEIYPDARLIVCSRDSVLSMLSQLSVVDPMSRLLLDSARQNTLRQKLLQGHRFYYSNLEKLAEDHDNKICDVQLWDFSRNRTAVIDRVKRFCNLETDPRERISHEADTQVTPRTGSTAAKTAEDYLLDVLQRWRHPADIRL